MTKAAAIHALPVVIRAAVLLPVAIRAAVLLPVAIRAAAAARAVQLPISRPTSAPTAT